jgi:hypothetical protein
MRLKWVCAGGCNATCGLYDLVGPNQGGGTCVYGWFFNGLLGINRGRLAWSERDSRGRSPGRLVGVGRRFPLRRRGSSEKQRQAALYAGEEMQALEPACVQLMAEAAGAEASGARVCAAHDRETTLEFRYSPLLHA